MNGLRNHALCESCYAGLVDIGQARVNPRRIDDEYRYETKCCICGDLTSSGLFLDAAPDRFGDCSERDPNGLRTIASFSRAEFNAALEWRDWGDFLLRSLMVPA